MAEGTGEYIRVSASRGGREGYSVVLSGLVPVDRFMYELGGAWGLEVPEQPQEKAEAFSGLPHCPTPEALLAVSSVTFQGTQVPTKHSPPP